MIGIIVALKSESENYLNTIQNKKHIKLAGKDFYTFSVSAKEIVYAISGIGKVNAAMTAQVMIDKFSPTRILNYGSAGGLNGKVKALDFYCIEKCCQYDFDLSPLDPVPVGYIQDYDKVYFFMRRLIQIRGDVLLLCRCNTGRTRIPFTPRRLESFILNASSAFTLSQFTNKR